MLTLVLIDVAMPITMATLMLGIVDLLFGTSYFSFPAITALAVVFYIIDILNDKQKNNSNFTL